MNKTRILFALTLTLACLGIISIVTVSAVNPEPSAHGSAQSGNLMLTLSAVRHQDGSVDGHATFRDRAANTKIDVDIDCLTVETIGQMGGGFRSIAFLSGVVSKSTSPDFLVGELVDFPVIDFGRATLPQPDAFFSLEHSTDPGSCLNKQFTGTYMSNEQGNIIVTD